MRWLSSIVAACLLAVFCAPAVAQSNAGALGGTVTDSSGAVVAGAFVRLTNAITGYAQEARTNAAGQFELIDVPFNRYYLAIEAAGFAPVTREVAVHSRLRQRIDVQLIPAAATQQVEVPAEAALLDPRKSAPSVIIDRQRILRFPTAQPSRSTETLIATAPGWTLNANGRLHARGIEYQVQYSIDGISITDTVAATFAASPDPRIFRSVEISTANIPAEYGSKLAGVIAVNSRSGLEGPSNFSAQFNGGSFNTFDAAFDASGRAGRWGYLVSFAGLTTDRFLDPPSFINLHNEGTSLKGFAKLDYAPNDRDLLRLNLFANGAGLQIPNLPEQEAAGQDQQRDLRDTTLSLAWQRIMSERTVGYFATYHRYASSKLTSGPLATPVFAKQSRHHQTFGALASLTHQAGRHTIKTGIESSRFPVREAFTFAVTNVEDLRERVEDLTPETESFTLARPFFFDESRAGWQAAAYVQDQWRATERLTLNLGLRFDSYNFLVDGNEVSPRLGAAYFIKETGTVLRASVDRLVETPAIENLLLSSSEATRVFSPNESGMRGLPVPLARSWQYDVGFQQRLSRYVRLDADFYYRRMRDNAEIINFIETEIVFPASLARSRSMGVESRLELTPVCNFSGFVSYTNLNIYGVAPITDGLFIGEAIEVLEQAGRRIKNEEDQRNTIVFEARYEIPRWRAWLALSGRHDSGYAVELDDDTEREDFEGRVPERILYRVNFERGFVKPHTVLNFSAGHRFTLGERARLDAQLNIENLTDEFYLFTFGSLFTGTNVGRPRSVSASLRFSFQ